MIIHCVIKHSSKEKILKLLQSDDYSKKIDVNGDTVLHAIVRNKYFTEISKIEIMRIVLGQGASVKIENINGETVLHTAIAMKLKTVVDFLLESGADIHIMNERGDSLAHFFVNDEYKNFEMAISDSSNKILGNLKRIKLKSVNFLEFLISKDLDFDRKNGRGESAVHLAISHYLLYLLPTLFLNTNAITMAKEDSKTLLDLFLERNALARQSQLSEENSHCNYNSARVLQCVSILVERGVPLITDKNYGCAVLTKAIERQDDTIVIGKLMYYYLTNCKDRHFASTLLYELLCTCDCWNNLETEFYLRILNILISKGADVNYYEDRGRMVYALAAINAKNSRVLEFLKANDVGFSFKLNDGKSLLHLLAEQNDYDASWQDFYSKACDIFVSDGCRVDDTDQAGKSALHIAAEYCNVSMVQKLLELGADVNCKDEDMRTALHKAANMGKSALLVELLLRNGADANVADVEGNTPLHCAAQYANASIVGLLVNHGASVNCRNINWQTPLHRAVTSDEAMEIVELLLSNKADVNAKDYKSDRPIHTIFNRRARLSDLLTTFLRHGAHVNMRNDKGKSALYYALSNESIGAVYNLLAYGADVNDPQVCQMILQLRAKNDLSEIVLVFSQHLVKLEAAKLTIRKEYRAQLRRNYKESYNECLNEIEALKGTIIDSRRSLYHLLYASRSVTRTYKLTLHKFIRSVEFTSNFPQYSLIFLAMFRQIIAGEPLLEPARETWYKLTDGQFPGNVDHVFDYLNNEDLVNLIEAI